MLSYFICPNYKPGHIFPPASLFVVWWYFVIRLYNTVIVIDIAITNCYMKSSKISIVIVDQQSHCLQQVHSNLLVRCQVPTKIYPPYIKASLFILSLSLFTMSSVDKKIDHIFVRNTFLFACDKRRRFRSISVPEEITGYFARRQ